MQPRASHDLSITSRAGLISGRKLAIMFRPEHDNTSYRGVHAETKQRAKYLIAEKVSCPTGTSLHSAKATKRCLWNPALSLYEIIITGFCWNAGSQDDSSEVAFRLAIRNTKDASI
jgi:hypothetical protein